LEQYYVNINQLINTKDNHLRYWLDDTSTLFRDNNDQIAGVEIGGCSRSAFSAKIELQRVAEEIYNNYPDLTLYMSGGLDSEIALRTFLSIGIRPRLKTVVFTEDGNKHDVGPMLDLVNSLGLEIEVVNFDPEEFYFSEEWKDVSRRYQAYTFYQMILLKMAELQEGPMITIDEIELQKEPVMNWDTGEVEWTWAFIKKEDQDMVWRRYNEQTGHAALNNFYTYSPEAMLAFMKLPTIDRLITNNIPNKLGWASSKNIIYNELGYSFDRRAKWTGMENYMHLWFQVRDYRIPELELLRPVTFKVPALELRWRLENGYKTVCQSISH
jgi:hypothetical protein